MKIYIAGSFVDQEELRQEAGRLWELGHEITGTWLHETKKPDYMEPDTFKKKLAIKDLCEVARADLLIQDNRRSSGGKNAELGFAIGQFQHKEVWVIGEPTNVFQYLADMRFDNWNELISFLDGR